MFAQTIVKKTNSIAARKQGLSEAKAKCVQAYNNKFAAMQRELRHATMARLGDKAVVIMGEFNYLARVRFAGETVWFDVP